MRLDKWLWAARFYKTRSLAQQAIERGHVQVDEERVKPSHDLKAGKKVRIRKQELEWVVAVEALSDRRGPAVEAQKLYAETPESRVERERRMDLRRLSPEPAASITGGRPTKRDRRRLEELRTSEDET